MTESPIISDLTPQSVAQALRDKGLQQIRGIPSSLPNDPQDATSIFAAGDQTVEITRIEDAYLIGWYKDGRRIDEHDSQLKDIVSSVTTMLGEDTLQKLQAVKPTIVEQPKERVAPISLKLHSLQCMMDDVHSQATVVLSIQGPDGEKVETFTATGDGLIDAICTAINTGAGLVVRFSSLKIASVATGADAQGASSVRIRVGKQSFNAEVVDQNIVLATTLAYLSAINEALRHQNTKAVL